MAVRLGNLVIRGELFNLQHYSVHGWLQLQGAEQPLRFELTGNCDPDLRGWHIRFENRNAPPEQGSSPPAGASSESNDDPASALTEPTDGSPEPTECVDCPPLDPPDMPLGLAWQQVGPTGTMTAARRVRIPPCSTEEFVRRCRLGEPPPTEWKRCLYLEWFSQNGRVVLELPDPILEFVEHKSWEGLASGRPSETGSEPSPEEGVSDPLQANGFPGAEEGTGEGRLSITSFRLDEDGNAEIGDESPSPKDDQTGDDPYQLIPGELERQFEAEAFATDQAIQSDEDKPQCIREMELLDDLIETSDGVVLNELFDDPLRLSRPEQLDDAQVESALKVLLSKLALFGIALDVCEHYTPREAYTLLLDRVCREERAYPELRHTQWVQHFATSDFCPKCEAEFEREYQERNQKEDPPQEHAEDWPPE